MLRNVKNFDGYKTPHRNTKIPVAHCARVRNLDGDKIPLRTNIPARHCVPESFFVDSNVGVVKSKSNVYIATPKHLWSKNGGANQVIVGRRLIPAMWTKEKRTTTIFTSTEIVCDFTTIAMKTSKRVASSIPKPIRSTPFIFRGLYKENDQLSVTSVKNRASHSPLTEHENAGSNHRKMKKRVDRRGPTINIQREFKNVTEQRFNRYQEMFKSRFAKMNENDVLSGIRLNRRFDLLMKYREDQADKVSQMPVPLE